MPLRKVDPKKRAGELRALVKDSLERAELAARIAELDETISDREEKLGAFGSVSLYELSDDASGPDYFLCEGEKLGGTCDVHVDGYKVDEDDPDAVALCSSCQTARHSKRELQPTPDPKSLEPIPPEEMPF